MGFVDITLYPDDEYTLNFVTDNVDRKASKKSILKTIPELFEKDEKGKTIFDTYIVYKPPSEEEEEKYEDILYTPSITELKDYDDQALFVEFSKEIREEEWEKLGENKEKLLHKYIEVGEYDIPDKFRHEFPKLWERYLKRLDQRVDIKFAAGDFAFTTHEMRYAIGKRKDIIPKIAKDYGRALAYARAKQKNIEPEIVAKFSKSPYRSYDYAKAKGFKDIEPEIIRGIAKSSMWSSLYARAKEFMNIEPEIITSIAKNSERSFIYAQAKGFKDIPKPILDTILKSSNKSKLPKKYTVAENFNKTHTEESFRRKLNNMLVVNKSISDKIL